jgi:hypothetical protein
VLFLLADPRLRFSLKRRVPLGESRDDKLINLGENRFSMEPQLARLLPPGDPQ